MYKLLLILCIYGILSCNESKKNTDMEKLRTVVKCAIDTIIADPWFLNDYYDYLNYFTYVPHISGTPPDSLHSELTKQFYYKMKPVKLDTNNIKCLHDIFPRKTSLQFIDINTVKKIRRDQNPPGKISCWIIGEFRQLGNLYYIEVGYSMTRLSGESGKFLIQLDSTNTCKILDIRLGVS